ncbi:MAG TPA: hypothetical protein ENN79_11765 [Desulfobacteraceae bacterium]|nr:hypothetical protein [Desulfobacteraceae bacterium]
MFAFYLLGAGFSKPAGLPLGCEIFTEVMRRIKQTDAVVYRNIVMPDVREFQRFQRRAKGIKASEVTIDLEEFMTFLDIAHGLGFEGSNHWSSQGNRTQLVIRNYIARVLYEAQSKMSPPTQELYDRFANHLQPHDVVLTFNYGTVLEQSLRRIGKPFRLFPCRFMECGEMFDIVDSTRAEVVILKMHGSINWFFIPDFQKQCSSPTDALTSSLVRHKHSLHPQHIIEGPFPDSSALRHVYRIDNLDKYFACVHSVSDAPLLVSPSHAKFFYLQPLVDFFYGLYQTGGYNREMNIIGFSMPEHDQYLLQAVYQIVRNYQNMSLGRRYPKRRLRIVDYRKTPREQDSLRGRYRFVNWGKASVFWDGFGHDAIDFLAR